MRNAAAVAQARTSTQSALPVSPWVEEVDRLDLRQFRDRYLLPRRPVVVRGALDAWPARHRFTPEFFLEHHADRVVRVRGRQHRLGDIVRQQLESDAAHPAPYPCTLADCRDLLPAITPRPAWGLPNRHTSALMPKAVFDLVNHLEIFFGGPGSGFPYLHYDMLHLHTWIAQVHGAKEFTFYEPGQEDLLYVHPEMPWMSRMDDVHDYRRWPLLQQARRHSVVLQAGDAAFVPCGVWHITRCVSMNITVAFDQLEASNWRQFVHDVVAEERRKGHRAQALWLGAYLGALGPLLGIAELFGANREADWGVARVH